MRIILEGTEKELLKIVVGRFNGMVTGQYYGGKFIGELDAKRFYNSDIMERKNNRANINIAKDIIRIKRLDHKWSFQMIADHLNQFGYKTSRDKEFKKTTVKRIFDKLD